MDMLETQASDLLYVMQAGAGAALPIAPSQHPAAGGKAPRQVKNHKPSSGMASADGDNSAFNNNKTDTATTTTTTKAINATSSASTAAATAASSHSPSPYSPDREGSNATSLSRKRRQESQDAVQRPKRSRYISIACNECKRRKIRCNGETPCERCGNLKLSCEYLPSCCPNNFRNSEEYKQISDKMHRLEEQMESLVQSMTFLRQDTLRLAPMQDRLLPAPSAAVSPSPSTSAFSLPKPDLAPLRSLPTFPGPTSIAFTVGVAKNTLHNMGYNGEDQDDPPVASSASVVDSGSSAPIMGGVPASGGGGGGDGMGFVRADMARTPPIRHSSAQSSSSTARQLPPDPLWDFDKDEMLRLCRTHEDEVGIMYPVVNIETVMDHARSIASWIESVRRGGYQLAPQYVEEAMVDIRTLLLKIIMCCALTVEEHGHSNRAMRLYESLRPIADRKLVSDPSNTVNLSFLALVAGYHFLCNEEVLAWRVMGQVVRQCLEQGLHRCEGLNKIDNGEAKQLAINTFWASYVLDRRWSFGTGLPYVVQDDKIDPKLPLPEQHPYLVAMIMYSRLGAKIWKLVDFFEPALILDLKGEDFETLDTEVLKWYDSCPDDVKISSFDNNIPIPSAPTYNIQRLQIWTRLRLNQMRIWLHTPILHSASSINANMPLAFKIVDLAKETIQFLTRLNDSTNLYRRIQVFYHQFLTSAIAVLFLASTHQPVQFSSYCRDEFYMALNLIQDMSARSWVSHRLWKTVRSLKTYAQRLGMQQEDEDVPAAAVWMAGMSLGTRGTFLPFRNTLDGVTLSPPPSAPQTKSSTSHAWQPPPLPPLPPPVPGFSSSRMAPLGGTKGQLSGGSGNGNTGSPAGGVGAMASPGAGVVDYSSGGSRPPAHDDGQSASHPGTPEASNGKRLQTEMTRIFEGYMNMGSGRSPGVQQTEDHHNKAPSRPATNTAIANARGDFQRPPPLLRSTDTGMYEHLKHLF